MNLKEKIENYIPYDEQEERDKEQYLNFIDKFDDVLTRNNVFGHFSASAFVVNKDKTKTLKQRIEDYGEELSTTFKFIIQSKRLQAIMSTLPLYPWASPPYID